MPGLVWTKYRSVDGDVVAFVKRWWLPRWFPGSAKLHGNLSSVVYAIEEDANKKCRELEALLLKLEQAKSHQKTEFKEVKSLSYNRGGETEWELEELKYLKMFEKWVPKPDAYYKSVLNAAFLRKFGLNNTNDRTKKSSHSDIPDNLAGSGERSIYVMQGTPQPAKNALGADLGADHEIDYRQPEGKKKSNNSKGQKKQQHWKNRRSGESQDDYDDRMEVGEENWED